MMLRSVAELTVIMCDGRKIYNYFVLSPDVQELSVHGIARTRVDEHQQRFADFLVS